METSLYERVGGEPFFVGLVGAFYDRVEADPILLALYPDQDDLEPARWRLTAFLIQYFGGPTTYSEQRGHPMLRARHHPYAIGEVERDHWLAAMKFGLDQVAASGAERAEMEVYFAVAAEAMRNQ